MPTNPNVEFEKYSPKKSQSIKYLYFLSALFVLAIMYFLYVKPNENNEEDEPVENEYALHVEVQDSKEDLANIIEEKFSPSLDPEKEILDKLNHFKKWGDHVPLNDEYPLFHKIYFDEIEIHNEKYLIGITLTNSEDNTCGACVGILSAFEFIQYNNEWRLNKSHIAFESYGANMSELVYKILPVSKKLYGVLISYGGGGQGYYLTQESLYNFSPSSIFSNIFSTVISEGISHWDGEYESIMQASWKFDQYEFNGYFPITVEGHFQEDGNASHFKNRYLSDGAVYVNLND